MADYRVIRAGQRLDYTCENSRFLTNLSMGRPHRPNHDYFGSVFGGALADDGEYALWLEHVTNKEDPTGQCYWFMWYKNGRPTIPMSGIFHRENLENVSRLLASVFA